jgi:hypothetical protein
MKCHRHDDWPVHRGATSAFSRSDSSCVDGDGGDDRSGERLWIVEDVIESLLGLRA